MIIRTATPAELDQVCALSDEVAELHNRREPDWFAPPDTARDRDFWLAAIQQEGGTVLVAERDGSVAGFVTARIAPTMPSTFLVQRVTGRVGTLAVANAHRRRGIGTALIRAIEAWAISRGARDVRLEVFDFNEAARAFYASVGYLTLSSIMHRAMP